MAYRYRFRRRRRAPRRKPRFRVEGWTAAELGSKVGVSARTVRFYTAQGVLPSPEFRGAATRYSRQHLVFMAAIRWLQRERRMSLLGIRQYLQSAANEEVERIAGAFLPELVAAPLPATAPEGVPAIAASKPIASDTWHRVSILPGLEVHWHATANAEVQALACKLVSELRSAVP